MFAGCEFTLGAAHIVAGPYLFVGRAQPQGCSAPQNSLSQAPDDHVAVDLGRYRRTGWSALSPQPSGLDYSSSRWRIESISIIAVSVSMPRHSALLRSAIMAPHWRCSDSVSVRGGSGGLTSARLAAVARLRRSETVLARIALVYGPHTRVGNGSFSEARTGFVYRRLGEVARGDRWNVGMRRGPQAVMLRSSAVLYHFTIA